jgi:hypothetical protein
MHGRSARNYPLRGFRTFGADAPAAPPAPTSAELERDRLEARRVPVLARIAKIDRELHLMSPTSKSQRDALIKERRSLAQRGSVHRRPVGAARALLLCVYLHAALGRHAGKAVWQNDPS